MINLEQYMALAIEEAKLSLREGNNGFGAVIIWDGEIIATAHDTEETTGDPTAHAEMGAIRKASSILGKKLNGCLLVATHEPCPMCATAVVWSGISQLAYGYSIKDALEQGRKRVNIYCTEIFKRAGAKISVQAGVMKDACALLYNKAVRDEIKRLRGADEDKIRKLEREHTTGRVQWFHDSYKPDEKRQDDPLESAYKLFRDKLGVSPEMIPIVERNDNRIVIHSKNFCPTLEACKILDLDTRKICAALTERPMAELLKQLNPNLKFSRNYDKLRPHTEFCEEIIRLNQD